MFVYLPSRGRYALAAAAFAAVSGGCTDPAQRTDIRSNGPVNVLAVMIMDDAVNGLAESATYCRANDDKRPSLVGLPDGSTHQICPADGSLVMDGVNDAYPQGWFVRIMFDELIDPSIEDLTPILDDNGNPTGTYSGSIAGSHPVELKCTGVSGAMVDIPYDGYYSPAGNNITWPVGPSIVVKPNLPATVPTNSKCQVTLNDVIREKGHSDHDVPADERGPFPFEIAPIIVASISPTDMTSLDAVDAGMDVLFNTLIDPDSFDNPPPPIGTATAPPWAFTPAAKASSPTAASPRRTRSASSQWSVVRSSVHPSGSSSPTSPHRQATRGRFRRAPS